MIIEFDKIYKDLVCENVPLTTENGSLIDPWDGEKPHAKDGFAERYCLSNENLSQLNAHLDF